MHLKPNLSEKAVADLHNILIPVNVSEVNARIGIKDIALYGQRARCGVVEIVLEEKKDLEKVNLMNY